MPWRTSGQSRALDPYFGIRLNDDVMVDPPMTPYQTRFRKPLHTGMPLIPWHTSGMSRTLDPYFGLRLGDDDILDPLTLAHWDRKFVPFQSSVEESKDMFEVNVDVQHFHPEEIKVTLSGNTLSVEGKHEEKPDKHGYIARHFVRKYNIPEGHDLDQLQSHLSSDGVLTIKVPKIPADGNLTRTIPIQQTGILKKKIEDK